MKSRNQSEFKKRIKASSNRELKEKIQYIKEINSQPPIWLVFLVRAIGAFMLVHVLPQTLHYLIQVITEFKSIEALLFGLCLTSSAVLLIGLPALPYRLFHLIRNSY